MRWVLLAWLKKAERGLGSPRCPRSDAPNASMDHRNGAGRPAVRSPFIEIDNGFSPNESSRSVSFFADRSDESDAEEAIMAKGQKRSANPKKWAV